MPSYFTHYWTNAQWDFSEVGPMPFLRRPGDEPWMRMIDHTAGNLFSRVGVQPRDVVFIITVKKGKLLLGGKVIVGKMCGQGEAERILEKGEDSWPIYPAKDHIIPAGKPDRFRPTNRVPDKVVERLLFEGPDGPKPLAFDEPGYLNQQTLRGVRRLTRASGELLESLL